MAAKRDVEALLAFRGRVAGSDAERRAAKHLERRLGELGREAVVEPISIFPAWHLTHALHALLAIAGSVLSVQQPVAGTALAVLALASIVGDGTGTFHIVRRLSGRRASQNVVSMEDGGRPGTLVLAAHYDSGRSGLIFNRPLPAAVSPLAPLFWSAAAIVGCAALRIADIEGTALTGVQFVPTVLLIVLVPLLVDVALSDPVPGANDNASGVATALRLAERHGGTLENFDLWVLFTGAQEGFALGMREFLRKRRKELRRTDTVFLNLDELGAGDVRFARREGVLLAPRTHPRLRKVCHELAEDDPDAHAAAIALRSPSDGAAALSGGYPAITITARPAPHHHRPTDTPANVDDDALERSFDFCSELIVRLDAEFRP